MNDLPGCELILIINDKLPEQNAAKANINIHVCMTFYDTI